MPDHRMPLIFDGHNDVLHKLYRAGGPEAIDQFASGQHGQIDLPRARKGGFGGGFFAIYVPSPEGLDDHDSEMQKPQYDLPLPPAIPMQEALPVVMQQAAILQRMQADGHLRICKSTDDIRAAFNENRIAAIMHIEGAEGIDADLYNLDVLYAAGLRSLGPVWSRPTIFGTGVPFRFPADGNIGGGLTEVGKNLIRRCNALGIMVDLSHLNEAGFWDVARISNAPLVATHSNAHALCHHARNLTDPQLEAIAASDGMVGLNFATAFLRKDGQMRPDVPLSTMLAHLDHLIDKLGEDRVGFGSDFDGAMVPEAISDVAGLGKLRSSMINHGYSESLMRKLCNENWLRVLARTWGEQAKT
ncbi:Microsomal dipeptidase [hydrothermal vent metagenome]|uniref:Microsomal dipeptidase n=1 Tax=hydrothermal vent metagenome TaxID=652676 RepID=A0A3B0SBA1_9ZZZZ